MGQITARLGSSRLPRKMLCDLEGAPVLEHLIRRLSEARSPHEMVVATTQEPEDDELARLAEQHGARVVRGPTQDVIGRWRQVAEETGADLVVNVDGDDVLFDPQFVDRIAEAHAARGADYITVSGLPFGAAPTGYSRTALERVASLTAGSDTEGQGRFFADPAIARPWVIEAPEELRHEEARMTLDYPEDLAFFAAVIRELGMSPPLARVVGLLRERPHIVAINAGRQEEYWRRFHERYPPVDLQSA